MVHGRRREVGAAHGALQPPHGAPAELPRVQVRGAVLLPQALQKRRDGAGIPGIAVVVVVVVVVVEEDGY